LRLALRGDFIAARDKLRKLMIEYGLSGIDVIKQVHGEIFKSDSDLSDEVRVLIADYVGEIQFRMIEGADDEIQLSAFLAWLSLLGKRLGSAK
ncbi:MAG: replication factor C small subunit, partial [Fervidicoccaceae archaeon]